jgi:serine/threonine protein phosphatase 1
MRKLTYAIGDIHGRLDLLLGAVTAIHSHGLGDHVRIVMLGDYVDRGPDSRGVVDYLIANAQPRGIVCLKGNHEAMMVEAIRGRDLGTISRWMFQGGEETMRSYGWTGRHAASAALIPLEHLDWMAGLPLMVRDEERVYVHAGVDPARALDEQDEATCLWIRDRFLDSSLERTNLHVVHGHTPEWREKPIASETEQLPHRTNLDTGAYMTGVLAIGVFESGRPGGPIEVLTVSCPTTDPNMTAPRWREPR